MSHEQPYCNFTPTYGYNDNTTLTNPGDSWKHLSPWMQWMYCVMFAITVPPAIVLNFMVICIVICVRKMRRNATNYPIFSLALADLLTSIFNTPVNFYYMLKNDWVFNEELCKIDQFLSNFFIAASVFTLLATSIDRYRVLCKPLGGTLSKRKMALIMFGIWAVSFIISIPYYKYYFLYRASPDSTRHVCKWDECFPVVKLGYHIFFLIFTYILPIFSMAYCYYCICILLWYTRAIGERNEGHCRIQEDRKRMILMLIWVVLSFAIGWLPFHVYFVIEGIWPCVISSNYSQSIYIILYWLAMLNSTMNPLIYYWFLPNFRRRFKQIFRYVFCLSSKKSRRTIGMNQLDLHDKSRTLAASNRKNGLSTLTTMDTFASMSQKHSLDALTDEEVEDAQ